VDSSALGVREVSILNYGDQHLDRANPAEAVAAIVGYIRRVQPDVVVTFGPDGAYGLCCHESLQLRQIPPVCLEPGPICK